MDITARQQAALRLMNAEGVDIMLVASHALARRDTIFHLSGYRPLGESLAVLSAMIEPRSRQAEVLWSAFG